VIGAREAAMTLEAALRDLRSDKPRVRSAAADALAGLREASPAEELAVYQALLRATRDDEAAVRYSAVCTLVELEMRDAVRRLFELCDDADSLVGQAAIAGLGELGVAEAFEPLALLLQTASAPLRFQAALSIAQIDAARAAPLLIEALADRDAEVQANAAAALGDCARAGVVEDALRALACARLSGLLEAAPPDLRLEAALALAWLGDRRATAPLCDVLADAGRGVAAAEALARLRDPAALPALRRVRGRFWAPRVARVAASAALARLGEGDGEREFLLDRARRGPADARGLAIAALGEARVPGAREVLEGILARRRDDQAAAAAAALGALGDPSARAALEQARAVHADPEVRDEAARALARLAPPPDSEAGAR
jgi:HEAT repeat protein